MRKALATCICKAIKSLEVWISLPTTLIVIILLELVYIYGTKKYNKRLKSGK